jgi:hypothetical protein
MITYMRVLQTVHFPALLDICDQSLGIFYGIALKLVIMEGTRLQWNGFCDLYFKWFMTMYWWFVMKDMTDKCAYRYVNLRVCKCTCWSYFPQSTVPLYRKTNEMNKAFQKIALKKREWILIDSDNKCCCDRTAQVEPLFVLKNHEGQFYVKMFLPHTTSSNDHDSL